MKTNGDDLAFPGQNNVHDSEGNFMFAQSHSGMTIRQYFAGLAMQGSICANDHASPGWITMEIANAHAKKAVMIADALIAALNTQALNDTPEELK